MIFEVVVYCGARKVFRILNLLSGTVYSQEYETFEAAFADIKDGEVRGDKTVKRVGLKDITAALEFFYKRKIW